MESKNDCFTVRVDQCSIVVFLFIYNSLEFPVSSFYEFPTVRFQRLKHITPATVYPRGGGPSSGGPHVKLTNPTISCIIYLLFTLSKYVEHLMEALWNLEDKLRLSTQKALILLVCAAFAVIALCTATLLKKKGRRKQLPCHDMVASDDSMRSCGWLSIKKVLMGSMRWSRANKWEGKRIGERPTPLLSMEGWESHNSVSPVWQRPILMGDKCELPRFSGLILYDERGRLLSQSQKEENTHHQVINKPCIQVFLNW